jgi:hypothetical protein
VDADIGNARICVVVGDVDGLWMVEDEKNEHRLRRMMMNPTFLCQI